MLKNRLRSAQGDACNSSEVLWLALTEDGQLLLTAPEAIDEPLDTLEHQNEALLREDPEINGTEIKR